jgi:hypothetical protein
LNQEIFRKESKTLHVVNPDEVQIGSRKSLRRVLGVLGLVGGTIYLSGLVPSVLMLLASGLALFLAITNFGRQCPLLMSLRYKLVRFKSRQIPSDL